MRSVFAVCLLMLISSCDVAKILDKNLPEAGGGGDDFPSVRFESDKKKEYKALKDGSFIKNEKNALLSGGGDYRADFIQAYNNVSSRFSLIDKPKIADFFKEKGQSFLTKADVDLEDPKNWIAGSNDSIKAFESYKKDVDKYLSTKNKQESSKQLATLQASFDCWLAEEGANIDEESKRCKRDFINSLKFFKEKEIPHVFSDISADTLGVKKTDGKDAQRYLEELEETEDAIENKKYEELAINYKGSKLGDIESRKPKETIIIVFNKNSKSIVEEVINQENISLIDNVVQKIGKEKIDKVVININTDTLGKEIDNQIISLKVAQAFKSELLKKGIEDEKIFTFAFGESQNLYKIEDETENLDLNTAEFLFY